jgi:hypothetical protein
VSGRASNYKHISCPGSQFLTTTSMITTIAFDANDTLWHNETLYSIIQEKFKCPLAPFQDVAMIDRRLYETEMRNLKFFGMASKGSPSHRDRNRGDQWSNWRTGDLSDHRFCARYAARTGRTAALRARNDCVAARHLPIDDYHQGRPVRSGE